MKLNFKNLGTIKSGCFHTNDLTILFGKNNSGKTYISYAVYILSKKIKEIISFLYYESPNFQQLSNMQDSEFSIDILSFFSDKYLKKLNLEIRDALSAGFCVPTDFFKNAEVNFDIDAIKKRAIDKKINITIKASRISKLLFITKKENSSEILIFISSDTVNQDNDNNEIKSNLFSLIYYRQILDTIISELFDFEINDTFIITSERTGIEQFYQELDSNRSSIMEEIAVSYTRTRPNTLFKNINFDSQISKYSLPIADNIREIREASSNDLLNGLSKSASYKYLQDTFRKMTFGSFKRNKTAATIFQIMDKNNKIEANIPLQVASSSIKALSLFEIYINKFGKEGQTLIIDEPELNLHPDNQIIMAELIVRLINSGVKIIISTHSDYIVREINNRIKLNNLSNYPNELNKYIDSHLDIISPERINVFNITNDYTIEKILVDETGISSVIFDEIIMSMSEREELIEESIYRKGMQS